MPGPTRLSCGAQEPPILSGQQPLGAVGRGELGRASAAGAPAALAPMPTQVRAL